MAQLTDDCFAFDGPMMTLAEAQAQIQARITPVQETQQVALSVARGRVLAAEVIAPVNLPPFDNSAVDGYAVRHADLASAGETRMLVAGRLQAGVHRDIAIGAGEAIRIFTGAPMPEGADTVFMQEDCRLEAGGVILPPGLNRGANCRLQGEDVAKGHVILKAGTRLGAQHIGLLAAMGLKHVELRRRIRVALFSTGDELAEAGQPLGAAAIYDANRPLLAGMAQMLGVEVTDLGILADDEALLSRALAGAAQSHDLVVTSGGVSTGEADYVKGAVESVGTMAFWRIAIKPGRPVAFAVLGGATPDSQAAFAGLPGNPVAAFITFAQVVRPLILRLAGALPEQPLAIPVRSAFAYRKKEGRREYVRVSLRRSSDGAIEASKYRQDGAGVISSLTATDGLLELPELMSALEPGMQANFISYAAFMGAI